MGYRIIVPCCYGMEHMIWRENGPGSLGDAALRNLFETGFPVHVAASEPAVVQKARSLGMDGFLLPSCESSDGRFAPGTREALAWLRGMSWVEQDTVIVADIRNPLLGKDTIARAIRTFESGDSPVLVSAILPRDHPCQFDRLMQLDDLIVYFPLDEDGKGRPFGIDWEYQDVTKDGLYQRVSSLFDHHYAPVTGQEPFVWEKLGESARVKAVETGKRVVAWSSGGSGVAPGIVFDGKEYRLDWPTQVSNGQVFDLKLLPFTKDGLWSEGMQCFSSEDSGLIIACPHGVEVAGWIGILSRVVMGGACDYSEPVCFPDANWKVVEHNHRVNTATNTMIRGRQDFPELFQMDFSLVIFRPGTGPDDYSPNNVIPFVLRAEENCRPVSEFDLVRMNIKRAHREG